MKTMMPVLVIHNRPRPVDTLLPVLLTVQERRAIIKLLKAQCASKVLARVLEKVERVHSFHG